ncbi:M28 family peptidase [Aggregicoccus sp. 17bor-14]|uniref:M28 family peptidase n=1 Tax=Myxococcaceae TaxID=31 RepID=UPI00129CDE79|nr:MULTISPECIES: M28 family peptidase [Myxococcaceae]MBF5041604.1 M28 family peptidase [Simulacricoccus sp. 17bor-14]MRI87389.1 M28 family peptidase [Aggregicoccus sp. 17bor-14]
MAHFWKGKRSWLALGVLVSLWSLILGAAAWVSQPQRRTAPTCMPSPVDPQRLKAHVRALSETLHPRDYEHPENLERAARYLEASLKGAGGRVRREPFEVYGDTFHNVVASFGPETGERLVVGAHYDAVQGTPGADDNASGVAGLLELAQLLGKRPPTMRVDLVAFVLEEPPFFGSQNMGSAVHARGLKKAGVKVRAMLSLEMLGCFSDAKGSQQYPVPGMKMLYPDAGNFIGVVGTLGGEALVAEVKAGMRSAGGIPVESLNAPRSVVGVDLSDHASFWDQGFPALMITDTAFLRNERYHRADDTWDTLDYPRMAQVVEALHCALESLAQG